MGAVLPIAGGLRVKDTIDPTSTKTIDTVPLAKFRSLLYAATLWNGSLSKFLNINVRKISGSSVEDSVFDRLGNLPLKINANISGSNVIIEVENPNAFLINVEFVKSILGA